MVRPGIDPLEGVCATIHTSSRLRVCVGRPETPIHPLRFPLPRETLLFLCPVFLPILCHYSGQFIFYFLFILCRYYLWTRFRCENDWSFLYFLRASFIFRSFIRANNKRYNTRTNTYSTTKAALETKSCSDDLFSGVAKKYRCAFYNVKICCSPLINITCRFIILFVFTTTLLFCTRVHCICNNGGLRTLVCIFISKKNNNIHTILV